MASILTSGMTLKRSSAVSILLRDISGKVTMYRLMEAIREDLMITTNTNVKRSWRDNVSVNVLGEEGRRGRRMVMALTLIQGNVTTGNATILIKTEVMMSTLVMAV